jgi:hypothetical protein
MGAVQEFLEPLEFMLAISAENYAVTNITEPVGWFE